MYQAQESVMHNLKTTVETADAEIDRVCDLAATWFYFQDVVEQSAQHVFKASKGREIRDGGAMQFVHG